MEIRSYTPSDREACLAVFDSNIPGYFLANERAMFAKFLDELDSPYFVADHDGAVVACGGFADVDGTATRLTWGMVRRDLHRNGVGKLLLFYRLRRIGDLNKPAVSLDTSQHTRAFFEKFGFRVVSIQQDGYGPGLDKIEMVKRLVVCA